MDFFANFHNGLSSIIDTLSSVGGHFLSAELEEEQKEVAQEVAQEVAKAFEGVAEKKTTQVHTIITVVLIPVGLIIGVFLLKMVYDMFTGAVDKVGKGVGTISNKLKTAVAGDTRAAAKNDSTARLPAMPKDPSKSGSRTMLLGQIIIRFVNETLTENDVEKAVRLQKQSDNGKKIGEILVEQGVVTHDDVARALKIQKKAR